MPPTAKTPSDVCKIGRRFNFFIRSRCGARCSFARFDIAHLTNLLRFLPSDSPLYHMPCRTSMRLEARDYALASASKVCPDCSILPPRLSGFGGKGIRTPDFQLAKLALYQLSYAPAGIFEFRLPIFECKGIKANAGCRSNGSTSGTRCFSYRF
jgi:hypothetical protein